MHSEDILKASFKLNLMTKDTIITKDVVATTRHSRTNDLTTSKALSGLSSNEWGNYKRTRQGALAALLLYLYKLQVVRATTICLPHVHPPCFYLMSYYSSTCVFLKATMLPTCALTSYF